MQKMEMDSNYIMALDQGTTSSRCILFDKGGNVVSVAQKEFHQFYPKPGWVEHDPMEIWGTQMGVAREAMEKVGVCCEQICGIGITNQRETVVVWNKETGKPICPAPVWQCRRTAAYCDQLKEQGLTEWIREKTGLLIDAYFSATKLQWILEEVEGANEQAKQGKLLFGTVDSWLIWNLTGGKVHATDCSNAARTMLFNIHTLQWDEELLQLFHIPRSMMPEVRETSSIFGETDPSVFGSPIPIGSAVGDQQAALFGQACFEEGMAKNTYGTGCFLLMNTGTRSVASKNGLLSTIAWSMGGKVSYALEGSVFVAGAAIQWLRDEMKLLETSPESEQMAMEVTDTNGVYVVPAFVGLGAPYWNAYARGTVVGLTRGANRFHFVRAALESLAYQTHDVLLGMMADGGVDLKALKVDGGACANDFLMQFQSDLIQTEVERPCCIETTALGAAYLAGLAVGYFKDLEEIKANRQVERIFYPQMDERTRQGSLRGWKRAVRCALYWAEEEKNEKI